MGVVIHIDIWPESIFSVGCDIVDKRLRILKTPGLSIN